MYKYFIELIRTLRK